VASLTRDSCGAGAVMLAPNSTKGALVLARLIPRQIHAGMDYALGALLIVSPWLLGFADDSSAATWIAVIVGAGIVLLTAVTDDDLSLADAIGMRTHLGIDIATGLFLAVSPWLFGFADEVWAPFVVIGLLELGSALVTDPEPMRSRRSVTT
jgi:hypothetical protein